MTKGKIHIDAFSVVSEMELNSSQSTIVNQVKGGLLVLAPVGTGKTMTLAERAAYAIASGIALAGLKRLIATREGDSQNAQY